MREFHTKYKRPLTPEEPGGGKKITSAAGYLSSDRLVGAMFEAGLRLASYRADQFDFADGSDTGATPSMRTLGYDMADAHVEKAVLEARIAENERELENRPEPETEPEPPEVVV